MRSLHTGSAFSETAFPSAVSGHASAMQEPPPQSEKREWTISEMARDFGLTLRALRFYESKGLISPQRFGGARFYSASDRLRLAQVLNAKKMGFTLAETAEMIGQAEAKAAGELKLSARAVDNQIVFLENQMRAIESALNALRSRRSELVVSAA